MWHLSQGLRNIDTGNTQNLYRRPHILDFWIICVESQIYAVEYFLQLQLSVWVGDNIYQIPEFEIR